MKDDFFYSPKGHRELSEFLAQEMLFDYATGALDQERAGALEKALQKYPNLRSDLEKIQKSLGYTKKLKHLRVNEKLAQRLKAPDSKLESLLQRTKFYEWPPLVRLGLEASVVALGIVSVSVLVPWTKILDLNIRQPSLILSQIDGTQKSDPTGEVEVNKPEISFPDEGTGADANQTASVTTTTSQSLGVSTTLAVIAQKPVQAPPTTSVVESSPEEGQADGKRVGFLYRGAMQITNVSASAPKIVEKITQLGARKAGNVELGWAKGDGAYFHFTVPENKFNEVQNVFKEYGVLKIQKEKHERVMPEGIVRIIISVDEKRP